MSYATSHGTDIYYEVHGSGDRTLVFAHGMGGNAAIWFNQLAHFSPKYRVVVFDHRYFARSKCPVEQFNPAWFTDDALAIMDAESIEAPIFVCQSMGGWTGSQMAIDHPDRIGALVMSHTPGVFTNEQAINELPVADLMSGRPDNPFRTPALAADFPDRNPAGAALYAEISSFNGIDPSAIPRGIGAGQLTVDTDSLTDYAVPTLFITADKDVLFPAPYITSLAQTVPGATCRNLGDAGHSSYFEIPDVFNEALQTFIDSQAEGERT